MILTASIDLSVGAILALCGAFAASLIASGTRLAIAMPIVLLAGLALGAVSGLIITYGAVQPFIATLVSMTVLRGAVLVFSNGTPIDASSGAASNAFGNLGRAMYSACRIRHRGRHRLRRMLGGAHPDPLWPLCLCDRRQ